MRQYEAVVIYPPGEAAVATGKSLVAEEFQNAGVRVVGEEDMAERDLAYEVKGSGRGHYYLYNVEAEPQAVGTLDRAFRIKAEVLKFQVFLREPRLRQQRAQRGSS